MFAKRFMELFAGMMSAHGEYILESGDAEAGKKHKGKARTLREPVTEDLWRSHIAGKTGIGIIPIREDNTAVWGCIDIDIYNLDHKALIKSIETRALPLIVCRTKSGGAHVFLFTQNPVPAQDMQSKLRELAASLGFGKSEIFPKQGKVLLDKGDLGNWLNMPYFEGEETCRYGMQADATSMSMGTFLVHAEGCRLTKDEFNAISTVPAKTGNDSKTARVQEDHPLYGAPPCLQTLAEQGLPEGTRNTGMYSFCVFAKKKFPDSWEAMIDQFNHDYFDPPLSSDEVQLIVKTVGKKDYLYKCNDQPICGFCNAALCRTRKHGIGVGGSTPIFSSISKLDTDPPLWFLDVEGTRIELVTDQLQNQLSFQKLCMEKLNVMPPRVKELQWVSIVNDLLENAMIIDAPKEIGIDGQFNELLDEFIREADIKSLSREELLLGRPWEDHATHRVYFRLKDLVDHLTRNNFKDLKRNQITTKIKARRGEAAFFNIKGIGTNVWWVPSIPKQQGGYDVPNMSNQAF